ncbi:hypothetical protein GCM10022384_41050 [Streptomyces marokkonensis]|uniref:SWIM zinc finger family protein n=1 Tax=Streptomyces marokkonensis TaxID=324855 RepID=A0ABP7QW17_9ACTN
MGSLRSSAGREGLIRALSVVASSVSSMTRSSRSLAYARPSALGASADGSLLGLETSRGATPSGFQDHPRFFSGFLTSPQAAAAGLLSVADIAAARYYRPHLAAWLDPVVTGNGDRLRFESFSGCCGVYARLDVLADALDGGEIGHGTSNFDVNNPLREALTRVGPRDPVHLRVGPDELAVTTLGGAVVEKKVPLPDRWLRGFAEAQAIAAKFGSCGHFLAAVEENRAAPFGSCRPGRDSGPRRVPHQERCACPDRSGWPRFTVCCGTLPRCVSTVPWGTAGRPPRVPGKRFCRACG